jgi:hypothetical protein
MTFDGVTTQDPTEISESIIPNRSEVKYITSIAGILTGGSYWRTIDLTWKIVSDTERDNLYNVAMSAQPVTIVINGVTYTNYYIRTFDRKTHYDTPPFYDISMSIESGRLT